MNIDHMSDYREIKAEMIALAAMERSLRKLRRAALSERKAGRLDSAHHTDAIADALDGLCSELRERLG